MTSKAFNLNTSLATIEIVSVDLFDTLLFRLVNEPKDVFLILEKIHNKRNFAKRRVEMEFISRERKYKDSGHFEVNLNEIYANQKELVDIELFVELSLIKANPEISEFVFNARKDGKTVIYTSDTYFDEVFIKTLLRKLKLPMPDKLYLSNVYAKSKADGNIYQKILNDFVKTGDRILHIGDNYISDIENAKRAGINTLYYQKNSYQGHFKSFGHTADQKLDSGIMNSLMKYGDYSKAEMPNYWFEIGYKVTAPIVLSQVFWLKDKLPKYDKALFVSRDGFLIYEIWNRFCGQSHLVDYLNVSRLLLVKIIAQFDFDLFVKELMRHKRNSISEVLNAYELSDLAKSSTDFDLSILGSTLNTKKNELKLERFLYANKLGIQDRYANSTSVYQEYLNQIFGNSEKVALIDLGWHGTTQKLISKVMNIEIDGYYWGLWPWVDSTNKYAFAFSGNTNITLFNLAKHCVEIFEFAVSAPHGTITGMHVDTFTGDFVPETSEETNEIVTAKEMIKSGVIAFYEDSKELLKFYNFLSDPHLAAQPISELILNPRSVDLRIFGKIEHSVLPGSSTTQSLILDKNRKFPLWIRGELRALSNRFQFINLNRLVYISVREFGYIGSFVIAKRKFLKKLKYTKSNL